YLELLDEDYLPVTATSWLPVADFTMDGGYMGVLRTAYEAREATLRILNITPLTSGAPEVEFTQTFVRYSAEMHVKLEAIAVPEPSTALLLLATMAMVVTGWSAAVAGRRT